MKTRYPQRTSQIGLHQSLVPSWGRVSFHRLRLWLSNLHNKNHVSRVVGFVILVSTVVVVRLLSLHSSGQETSLLRTATSRKEENVFSLLGNPLPSWQEGFLDLHHLRVGSSVSTLVIMPDGTTMLVDAGEVSVQDILQKFQRNPKYRDFDLREPYPNKSKNSIGWIFAYLMQHLPSSSSSTTATSSVKIEDQRRIHLNYFLLTHFHRDHYGDMTLIAEEYAPLSGNLPHRPYNLTGITELAEYVRIDKIIDRGYPYYNYPRNLLLKWGDTPQNYYQFVRYQQELREQNPNTGISFESFLVGSASQIKMLYYEKDNHNKNDFEIRIIKSNMDVAAPPFGEQLHHIDGLDIVPPEGKWDENLMSTAFTIRYGDFVYYEGGDQDKIDYQHESNNQPTMTIDTVGPTARAVGDVVDIASLNNHGHGVTKEFVDILDSTAYILQTWCSDQPPAASMELLVEGRYQQQPNKKPFIFATDVFEERLQAMGPQLASNFASTGGHVVVRALPPELNDSSYTIYVLNQNYLIQSIHGPYAVRPKKPRE